VATRAHAKRVPQSVAEERSERQTVTAQQLAIYRGHLPGLRRRLSRIADPRNPKKTKHRMAVVMAMGLLSFVFQKASRRQANQELTRPMFVANLRLFFPDIEELPHHDTLNRLLSRIEVQEIESAHLEFVRRMIRNKKFGRYLVDQQYPIAIDGTQKLVRGELLSAEWQQRTIGKGDATEPQYYVGVVEANLAFRNGMTMPLMSEILEYAAGDPARSKQDCETKAFHRLAERLKRAFPRLRILVLLDGLYPNGPVLETCRKNRWQFMIVLPDKSLPSVWEDYHGLRQLERGNEHRRVWGRRRQQFHWINHIEYRYGDHERKRQSVHLVVCDEAWEEIEKGSTSVVTRTARHVWLSSEPLNRANVHERCNLGARHRWAIESSFLVEKRHGYHYEHCFSYDWQAMKGYHYLMRLAHALNVLALYSSALVRKVRELGVSGLLRFVYETLTGPWLDGAQVQALLDRPFQLRLV
jgi:hypothetical protein